MDKIVIVGGKPLYGAVPISGAKNAALPLLAATLLAPGVHILKNVPDLRDTRTFLKLLASFGVRWNQPEKGTFEIDTSDIFHFEASYDLVKTMRASVLVLGPLIARMGRARVSLPGGCAIGARPVNFHLDGFQRLGVQLKLEHGYMETWAEGGLQGATICFDIPSVTATENILMAATLAKGETIITNAAREPEIGNLIDMLAAMGAVIEGKDTDTLTIQGCERLFPCTTRIIPDRIETGTYAIAVGATGGDVTITDCKPGHLSFLFEKLRGAGMEIEEGDTTIRVRRSERIRNVDIKTLPYPGFPTDLQAQMMALMNLSDGLSVIHETIFENRFMHVAELCRMGADISVDGRTAVVKGTGKFNGARVMATDLRASASLVVAALAAEGRTEISRVYHLDRGYENLDGKLSAVGATIWRESE